MKYQLVKKMIIILCAFAVFSLASCSKPDEDASATEHSVKGTSAVLNDEEFKNSVHSIQNPATSTSIIVNGDGEIVLKTMEPDLEYISVVNSIYADNKVYFLYKMNFGEELVISTSSNSLTNEVTEYKNASERTTYYDVKGNPVGFVTDGYGPRFSTKTKLIYDSYNSISGENPLRIYDVYTKEITIPEKRMIDYIDGKIILSDESYENKDKPKEMLICDDELNVIKTISGYSLATVDKRKNVTILGVTRFIKKESTSDSTDYDENNYIQKFNYLDEDFNLLFEEDIDERIYDDGEKYPVVTLRRGDIEFDYDFSTYKQVGDERPFNKQTDKWLNRQEDIEKYSNVIEEMQKDERYIYVDAYVHDGKVIFVARKRVDDNEYWSDVCDIYDDKLEKKLDTVKFVNVYEEEGYLLINDDSIYDFDFKLIKTFDEKIYLNRMQKFGKTFFADSDYSNMSTRKNFTLYDKDLNPIYNNIDDVNTFTYDDYIVMVDSEGTKILDKDFNAKLISEKKLEIRNWYGDIPYDIFTDLDTKRMGIIDNNYNILVEGLKYAAQLTEKYFTYQSGFKYGLMDYSGKEIFTYSIFDTMSEDARKDDFKGEYVVKYDDYY